MTQQTFIDSHAHITMSPLWENIETILSHAKDCNVSHIVNICVDKLSLERAEKLSPHHPNIVNVGATSPHDVAKEGEKYFDVFANSAKNKFLHAIGEVGLDYYYNYSPKDTQQHFLKKYLLLAIETQLPVVIHCREAFNDLFTILDQNYIVDNINKKVLLHCFTGTIKEATEALKRGWFISFSGIITFKKSHQLREVVKHVPLEQMLIETDAPYLAPQSKRGTTNEPANVVEVAKTIAEIKNISIDSVAKTTGNNTKLFFDF
jgi:TatD DNase family protein